VSAHFDLDRQSRQLERLYDEVALSR
jgi:hypothetical protein